MTAISDGCYVLHLLLSSSFSRGAKEQQKGKRNKINKIKNIIASRVEHVRGMCSMMEEQEQVWQWRGRGEGSGNCKWAARQEVNGCRFATRVDEG